MYKNLFSRLNIPKINLLVGTSALIFQITVLNPWHNKISIQINRLEDKIK